MKFEHTKEVFTPDMSWRKLMSLSCDVALQTATDAELARAVALFRGDINVPFAFFGWCAQPLLTFVLGLGVGRAPLTLAALAARRDVDLYVLEANNYTPAFRALNCGNFSAFFSTFPWLDVNVPCDEHGHTPLAILAININFSARWLGMSATSDEIETLEMLLDAGAIVTDTIRSDLKSARNPAVSLLMSQHKRWGGLRSAWAVAIASAVVD